MVVEDALSKRIRGESGIQPVTNEQTVILGSTNESTTPIERPPVIDFAAGFLDRVCNDKLVVRGVGEVIVQRKTGRDVHSVGAVEDLTGQSDSMSFSVLDP